jgi:hypothetical protein
MDRTLTRSLSVLVVALAFGGGCGGGFKNPGDFCEQSSDCKEGLECMQTAQGDVASGCSGIIQPKLCTQPCTSDDDCAALGLACNRPSSCGARVDRCGR